MIQEFLQTEIKLIGAWVGAGMIAVFNKAGFITENYEFWVEVTLDILTAISLIIVIGYTITRWRKLVKDNKSKIVK